jgi:TM2 domain-containing membrane protein YozV
MKVYRFKCKDCGATKYKKLDESTYSCEYCGYIEEVHREEKKDENFEKVETPKHEPIINFEGIRNEARRKPLTIHYIILLVACIFGGTFGIHRFLEKKFISGIVYLFTFGLFGIGIFVDVFSIIIKLITAHGKEKYIDYESGVGEHRND